MPMQDLIRRLLADIGEDPSREGLLDTPKRVEKAFGAVPQDGVGRISIAAHLLNDPRNGLLPGLAQRLRPDVVQESDHHARYQQNAPQVEAGLYLVPKVIE